MIVLGLTGSIGMGKSTAAAMLRRLGVPVFEADREVHRLLEDDRKVKKRVGARFPEAMKGGEVDRGKLGAVVFADPEARRDLEAILHPLVRAAERRFLKAAAARRVPVAALDIPLLFETGADRFCDVTIVVTAPPFVQRGRVMRRASMTPARYRAVLGQQMPDLEKRKRADFVVETGNGVRATLNKLRAIVTLARNANRRATRGGNGG